VHPVARYLWHTVSLLAAGQSAGERAPRHLRRRGDGLRLWPDVSHAGGLSNTIFRMPLAANLVFQTQKGMLTPRGDTAYNVDAVRRGSVSAWFRRSG
jgi:hypothetical protein